MLSHTYNDQEGLQEFDGFLLRCLFDLSSSQYLWRAVDQDGGVIDIFLQERRNNMAAKKFLKRLIASNQSRPRKFVTDKLGSYRVAHRELMADVIHDISQYTNNKAELSHQPTRVRECGRRRFKSIDQAQRLLSVHAVVHNHFNLGRGGWFQHRTIGNPRLRLMNEEKPLLKGFSLDSGLGGEVNLSVPPLDRLR